MSNEKHISEGNHFYEDEDLDQIHKEEEEAILNPGDPDRNGGDRRKAFVPMDPERKAAVKRKFLELLCSGMSVAKAVATINGTSVAVLNTTQDGVVSRKQMYVWRKWDKQFQKDWDEAYSIGTDVIEDKGHEFAIEGNAALIQFLLRVRNPKRYAMNRHEVSGPDGGAIPYKEITRTIVDSGPEDGSEGE